VRLNFYRYYVISEKPASSGQKLRGWIKAAVPITAQLKGYRPDWLRHDITAGLAIAAVALPTAVPYPVIAGLPPAVGLYASILPPRRKCDFWFVSPADRRAACRNTGHSRSFAFGASGSWIGAAKDSCIRGVRDSGRFAVPVFGSAPFRVRRQLSVMPHFDRLHLRDFSDPADRSDRAAHNTYTCRAAGCFGH
jgi:hypothetical protein